MNRHHLLIQLAALAGALAMVAALCGCGGDGDDDKWKTFASGLVLDADTGAPVSGATVLVGSGSAPTDSAGAYTVDAGAPGLQTVQCLAVGYENFPASGAPPVEVVLQFGPNTIPTILLVPAGQQPPPTP